MLSFAEMVFYFLIYAFLGWCVEVAFAAMKSGKFVNRGFLNGPYCPIYGFGALLVILCLTPLQHNLAALFLGSCAITTLLEYMTGAALEKLFHTRWWDYSDMPFNIRGHVCLLFSVLWGLACTFVMRIIQPLITQLYAITPFPIMLTLIIAMAALMLADAIVTVLAVRKLTRRLQRITELADDLRRLSDEIGESISDRAIDAKEWWDDSIRPKLESLDERTEQYRESVTDAVEELREKIDAANDAIESKRAEYRESMTEAIAELYGKIDLASDTIESKRAEYRESINDAIEELHDKINTANDAIENKRTEYRESVTNAIDELHDKIDAANDAIENKRAEYQERIDDLEDALDEKRALYRQRLQQLSGEFKRGFVENRMLNAYPRLKDLRNQQSLDRLREYHERLTRKRK